MKTFEKPFEYLGSKEKEAIDLCAEIVRWTTAVNLGSRSLFAEKSKLREEATKLYETLGKMDFEHDDKYYEIYGQCEALKKNWEELKRKVEKYKVLQIDFSNEETSNIIKGAFQCVEKYGAFSGEQFAKYVGGYGDHVRLSVYKESENKYKVWVNELWDYSEHESRSHLEQMINEFEEKFPFKISKYSRLHDYASAYELDLYVEDIPQEEMASVMEFIIKNIKLTPRVRKK